MAQLFFKRAKIFMLNNDSGAKRYLGTVSAAGTADARVPDWVRETETFKQGIKDGSIIDLTPVPQRRREPAAKKALGHDPLKEATEQAKLVDEAPSAQGDEGDDAPPSEGEAHTPASDDPSEAAQETEAPAKQFGNQMPQKTPKGFSAQPTATGRRAK